MKTETARRDLAGRVGGYATLLAILAMWEAATVAGLVSDQVLPRFSDVAATWWDLLVTGELLQQTVSSLGRQIAGFLTAVVVGVSLGIGMARSRAVDDFAGPLVALILPIPKAALIPLVMLWFGIGDAAKTIIVFLGTILPIVVSAYHAAAGVDHVISGRRARWATAGASCCGGSCCARPCRRSCPASAWD